jgi:murein DD-endopeptidase MepM/ murein hydrolase activator NlpD
MNRMVRSYGLSGADPAADPPSNDPRRAGALSQTALADVTELRNITTMMGSSVQSLTRVLNSYRSVRRVLRDLPTEWPVKGGGGTVTTLYGPTIDPVTQRMYLSTGVDIAYWAGAPIVASANGVVVMTAYEPLGYGNFVFIRHHFGFYTRYAHLMQIYVHEGEHVKQGQVIGLLGSSGLSAGPYLHFEVWLGNQVVDPMSFLDMRGHPVAASASRN